MSVASVPQHSLIDGVVARVCADFPADATTVEFHAAEILRRRYSGARVQSFIPILVERELRELLRTRNRAPDRP